MFRTLRWKIVYIHRSDRNDPILEFYSLGLHIVNNASSHVALLPRFCKTRNNDLHVQKRAGAWRASAYALRWVLMSKCHQNSSCPIAPTIPTGMGFVVSSPLSKPQQSLCAVPIYWGGPQIYQVWRLVSRGNRRNMMSIRVVLRREKSHRWEKELSRKFVGDICSSDTNIWRTNIGFHKDTQRPDISSISAKKRREICLTIKSRSDFFITPTLRVLSSWNRGSSRTRLAKPGVILIMCAILRGALTSIRP